MYTFLLIIFIIDVLLLIPVILMQSGSGAEAGMFGSNLTMGAFGAKTSEVLTNFTKVLVGVFMVLAFLLGYIKIQETKEYSPDTSTETITDTGTTATETTTEEPGATSETAEPGELPGIETESGGGALPLGDTESLKLDF